MVTGGAGYIGSHTVIELLDENKDNREFQENISKILKEEIVKYKNIEEKEENLSGIEGNNE